MAFSYNFWLTIIVQETTDGDEEEEPQHSKEDPCGN